MTFIPPTFESKKFTCPNCNAIALQRWLHRGLNFEYYGGIPELHPLATAKCDHCEEFSIWLKGNLLFPNKGEAPQPNQDLPESVKIIYLEAAAISSISPRGTSALLRLAIQVLCKELGEEGRNINDDIASLVEQGLPKRVQQALDIVRVTGNNAVHPGQIDVDNPNTAGNLFGLINVITEYTISMPNKINNVYDELPEGAKDAIIKRDKKP